MVDSCACASNHLDLSALDALLNNEINTSGGGNLVAVLQKTQALYGYLPRTAIEKIARALNTKPAKVMGVASFYTQFRFAPVGRNLIQLCRGTACHVNGANQIGAAIADAFGITDGQTTPDGFFTLTDVACLGCCSLSPVMTVNGVPYGPLTPDSAVQILRAIQNTDENETYIQPGGAV